MSPRLGKMPLVSRHCCKSLELVRALLRDLTSPLATSIGSKIDQGDWASVVGTEIDPRQYEDMDTFRSDYLAVEILSKFPNFDLGIDRQAVAIEKFLKSERDCAETNVRLAASYGERIPFSSPLVPILYQAQLKIGRLLGPFDWNEAARFFAFGPGSSLTLNRSRGDSFYKFGNLIPTTTKANAALAYCAICAVPRWRTHLSENSGQAPKTDGKPTFASGILVVEGNRISTVPKNAKTDRIIATEPDMNMYIQKGLGAVLRRRLKRVGVDLDSQELNQRLAREGSVDGSLATIDLSSASDSIATELVEMLLPVDWVTALKQCRSPVGVLPDGTILRYQKFSSMGNGFTFELQSLLFWALASSVIQYLGESDTRHAVYGDDIIVPVSCYSLLSEVLSYCGFTCNEKKTFATGWFRESCGKHYFRGVDVTPIYIRSAIDSSERLFWWVNSVRCKAADWQTYGCDIRFKSCYDLGISFLPKSLRRPSVPLFTESGLSDRQRFSDTAVGGDFDEVRPKRGSNPGVYTAVGYVRVFKPRVISGWPALLRSLSYLERGCSSAGVAITDFDRKWLTAGSPVRSMQFASVANSEIPTPNWSLRKVKSEILRWGNVGPWIG
jgi:hypothetical protein